MSKIFLYGFNVWKYMYLLSKFNAKNADATFSNWPRFVCAVYLDSRINLDQLTLIEFMSLNVNMMI